MIKHLHSFISFRRESELELGVYLLCSFPKHKKHCINDVAFATSIGPDNSGETLVNKSNKQNRRRRSKEQLVAR